MIATSPSQQDLHALSTPTTTYQIYGFRVRSNFSFTHTLSVVDGQPDLLFMCISEPPIHQDWKKTEPVFPGVDEPDLGVSLYPQGNFDILHFPGSGDFYIWPDQILCHPITPINVAQLEIDFLGTVLSFWLERQGYLALHASAIALPAGGAAGFLATSQGGKSSLAAAFIQRGYSLLTDDILPVELNAHRVTGRPGYAQMRLWPDQAQYFLGHFQDLELVHPEISKRRLPMGRDGWGNFCSVSQSINRLYLPERRDPHVWGTEIEIISLSPRDAVIELIRQSFAAPILHAMGILPERLMKLSQVVQHVPVRRLLYPNGMNYLPQVCDAIQSDCSKVLPV